MGTKAAPLGDIHNGKQTSLITTDTETYIFKPRSSKNEEAFDLFCHKIQELGFCDFARGPRLIQKGENHHTQCVEKNEKTDNNGADLYYKRAGVLLFFAYLLGANDLHCENLIANEDMPVIIDMETLLTGRLRGTSNTYNLSQSIMRSHLLCSFMTSKTETVDVSGFCGVTAEYKNIPHTDSRRVYLWQKRDIFIKSFEEAYRFALENKAQIAELIHIFDRCEFRQLLRPTKTYQTISLILSKIKDNREEYANALLARAYEKDVDKNRLQEANLVLQEEVNSALKGEIPLFYTYGNETALYCNKQKVLEGHLVLSPVDFALSRLDNLSVEDMRRQTKIANLAIYASTPIDNSFSASVSINKGSLCSGEITAGKVTDCAVDGLSTVFCGLQRSSGSVDFISYNYSLYQGLCGVLCMYAALYRKTGKSLYKDLLLKYYENVRKVFLSNKEKILLTNKNCSLADGITGVISCMEHIGKLTDDSLFVEDAKSVANRLYISEPITDTDYLNGAGALLSVLDRINSDNFYDISLKLSSVFEATIPFTTGVAHGSSGLALSLCALSKVISEEKFENTLLSVLQWENKHYSVENNNWFDLRDKDQKGFMSGWCSGAPGIGMARKYIGNHTENIQIKALCETDTEKAKTFLQAQTVTKRDTLCCGAASRLMSASALGVSVDKIYADLCNAEKSSDYRVLHLANTNDRNVSLMQGMSGIAYALAMYGDSLSGGMLI